MISYGVITSGEVETGRIGHAISCQIVLVLALFLVYRLFRQRPIEDTLFDEVQLYRLFAGHPLLAR